MLAASDAVRAFMVRELDSFRDPETGEVLTSALADAALNTFGLLMVDDTGRVRVPAALHIRAKEAGLAAMTRRAREGPL